MTASHHQPPPAVTRIGLGNQCILSSLSRRPELLQLPFLAPEMLPLTAILLTCSGCPSQNSEGANIPLLSALYCTVLLLLLNGLNNTHEPTHMLSSCCTHRHIPLHSLLRYAPLSFHTKYTLHLSPSPPLVFFFFFAMNSLIISSPWDCVQEQISFFRW